MAEQQQNPNQPGDDPPNQQTQRSQSVLTAEQMRHQQLWRLHEQRRQQYIAQQQVAIQQAQEQQAQQVYRQLQAQQSLIQQGMPPERLPRPEIIPPLVVPQQTVLQPAVPQQIPYTGVILQPALPQQVPRQGNIFQPMPQNPAQAFQAQQGYMQPGSQPQLRENPIPPLDPSKSPHPAPAAPVYHMDTLEDGRTRVSRVLRVRTAHKPAILQEERVLTPPGEQVKQCKEAQFKVQQLLGLGRRPSEEEEEEKQRLVHKIKKVPVAVRMSDLAARTAATQQKVKTAKKVNELLKEYESKASQENQSAQHGAVSSSYTAPDGSTIAGGQDSAKPPIVVPQQFVATLEDGSRISLEDRDAYDAALGACRDAVLAVTKRAQDKHPIPLVDRSRRSGQPPNVQSCYHSEAGSQDAAQAPVQGDPIPGLRLEPQPEAQPEVNIASEDPMEVDNQDDNVQKEEKPEQPPVQYEMGYTTFANYPPPPVVPVDTGVDLMGRSIDRAQPIQDQMADPIPPPPVPIWINENQLYKRQYIDYSQTLDALHTSGARSVYINERGQIQKISPESTDDGKSSVFGGDGKHYAENVRADAKPHEIKAVLAQEPYDIEQIAEITPQGEAHDQSDELDMPEQFKDQDWFNARCLLCSQRCTAVVNILTEYNFHEGLDYVNEDQIIEGIANAEELLTKLTPNIPRAGAPDYRRYRISFLTALKTYIMAQFRYRYVVEGSFATAHMIKVRFPTLEEALVDEAFNSVVSTLPAELRGPEEPQDLHMPNVDTATSK